MLQTKTCSVLGAGASHPYGFQSGGELAEELVTLTAPGHTDDRRTSFRKRMVSLMNQRGLTAASEAKVFEFSNLLHRSNLGSIDRFLNFHRKDPATVAIGKAGIGFLLGEREDPERARSQCKRRDTDHWLGFLWDAVTTGALEPSDVLKNPLSFVTFNYDRSLEFLLTDFAKASFFGWDEAECEALLDAWPITHVYGDLGAYPRHGKGGTYVAYAEGTAFHHMDAAIDRIRTIHEVTQASTSEDAERATAARTQIADAERVIFLGCAYHEENMKLLGLHQRSDGGPQCLLCRYGLSDVQTKRAVAFIGGNETQACQFEHFKSREYLRNTIDL
jgi:hypothetical protein